MDMDIIHSAQGYYTLSTWIGYVYYQLAQGYYTLSTWKWILSTQHKDIILSDHGYGYYPLRTRILSPQYTETIYCTRSIWIWILSPQLIDFTESQQILYFKI